ncbi:tetratricopeptide repeat protein [Mesobacterium pallidum]|uniref:tetratricopeptide repeat protein n=1 Tax=Mesobacterium pallidum TaxID=2872037 RepID=UPI001EE39000|nr:tetratricopeptide repeat protein [Mesobacterium pallidum]
MDSAPQKAAELQIQELLDLAGRGDPAGVLEAAAAIPNDLLGEEALLAIATAHVALGQTAKSRTYLEAAVDRAETPWKKAGIIQQAQELVSPQYALYLVQQQLKTLVDSPRLRMVRSRILFSMGRADEAEAFLEEAITPLTEVVLQLAQMKVTRGAARDALDLLNSYAVPDVHRAWHSVLGARASGALGEFKAMLSFAKAGLLAKPDHLHLQTLKWQAMMALELREEIVLECKSIVTTPGSQLGLLLLAAHNLNLCGELDACDEAMRACRQLAPDNAGVLLQQARIHMQRKEGTAAVALLSSIAPSSRTSEQTSLLALGQRRLGDLTAAIETLENYLGANPGDVPIILQLANDHLQMGDLEKAQWLLASIPDDGTRNDIQKGRVQSEIAFEKGDFADAVKSLKELAERDPSNLLVWELRARIETLLGQLEDAARSMAHRNRLRKLRDASGLVSDKILTSLPGQILNEYRLFCSPEDLAHCAATSDQNSALLHFLSKLDQEPTNTPAAISAMAALNRLGRIGATSRNVRRDPERPTIPPQVFQFWDTTDLPQDVADLVMWNRSLNPGYDFDLFDDVRAVRYLRDKGEDAALRGFRLAPHPAGRSDILRLALLWHEGGIYLDADDRCVGRLSEVVDPELRFVGYQENVMSVGNNFIAVAPKDPIIRAALDDAAHAFHSTSGESLWLATGPGALTRAFARIAIMPDGQLAEGIQIYPARQLSRTICFHTMLSYKATRSHWSNAPVEAATHRHQ